MKTSDAIKHSSCWPVLLVALLLHTTAASSVEAGAAPDVNDVRLAASDGGHGGTQRSCTADTTAFIATATGADALCRSTQSWELPFTSSASIPMQLWQTSRSSKTSKQAWAAMQSWHNLNPNLTTTLHNDTAAADFIRTVYGEDAFDIFQSFPLGVMRADFWRYAVLYAYGGIYADIDTQCIRPLEQWFPPRKPFPGEHKKPGGMVFVSEEDHWQSAGELGYYQLSWSDCRIVIALENKRHFCQWTIASVPGHPIFKEVIHLILHRAKQGFNTSDDHMVHHHTGPGIWTEAILNTLNLQGLNATAAATAVWTDAEVYSRARSLGVCIVAASFWGTRYAQNTRHMYGSLNFKEEGYPRWRQERGVLQGHSIDESSLAKPQADWLPDGIGLPVFGAQLQGSVAVEPEFW